MTCKLVVTGEGSTTREDVAGVLAYHRSRGRTWFDRRPRPVPAGTRVAAKVAGVSELWMTGTVRTGEPYLDPDGPNPRRWPWAMNIDWNEPAERGIPIGDVYGTTGVYARGMLITIDPDEFAASERRLYP